GPVGVVTELDEVPATVHQRIERSQCANFLSILHPGEVGVPNRGMKENRVSGIAIVHRFVQPLHARWGSSEKTGRRPADELKFSLVAEPKVTLGCVDVNIVSLPVGIEGCLA